MPPPRMLDAPDPPTAFVVSSIIPAIGVRRAAGERASPRPGPVAHLP
jgi:hypothetical protein